MELARKNANRALDFVEILREQDDPELDDCVYQCEQQYGVIIELFDRADEALRSKDYKGVEEALSEAILSAEPRQEECHASVQRKNVMTKRNRDVRILLSITSTFARLQH